LRSFKWYLNHGAIDWGGSLRRMERTSGNETFANWLFHGEAKIGVCSHSFSATPWIGLRW
jgi:hypothetical protein